MRRNSIIGIDEAGRGPLAGPVVVAGVKITIKHKGKNARILRGVRDSKKLSPKQREAWYARLTAHPDIQWAVARVWPKVIDRINISRAADLGARRVCGKLCFKCPTPSFGNNMYPKLSFNMYPKLSFGGEKLSLGRMHPILLDAGLRLPSHLPHLAIIKGDEKIPVIAAASIIAKVTRDRIMLRLNKKYPEYRFDLHKGYGTALHREMIRQFGRCEIHRKSFRCA